MGILVCFMWVMFRPRRQDYSIYEGRSFDPSPRRSSYTPSTSSGGYVPVPIPFPTSSSSSDYGSSSSSDYGSSSSSSDSGFSGGGGSSDGGGASGDW